MNEGRLTNNLTYLVGSIDYSTDFGVGWRKEITPFLHNLGIGVLDPTDKPSEWVNEDEDEIKHLTNLKQKGEYNELSRVMKNIVSIDLHLLDLSNFIIAYLDWDVRITGSITELTYAALEKKPIIVICPQGKKNMSNWLFGLLDHELWFNSVGEAKSYLEDIHYWHDGRPIVNTERWRFLDYGKVYGNVHI